MVWAYGRKVYQTDKYLTTQNHHYIKFIAIQTNI
jgi:hypothetical protein